MKNSGLLHSRQHLYSHRPFQTGVFASDDLRARAVAQEVNIPVVGSVGVLIRGIRRQLLSLSSVQEMLDQMIASGYYSPIDQLESFFE